MEALLEQVSTLSKKLVDKDKMHHKKMAKEENEFCAMEQLLLEKESASNLTRASCEQHSADRAVSLSGLSASGEICDRMASSAQGDELFLQGVGAIRHPGEKEKALDSLADAFILLADPQTMNMTTADVAAVQVDIDKISGDSMHYHWSSQTTDSMKPIDEKMSNLATDARENDMKGENPSSINIADKTYGFNTTDHFVERVEPTVSPLESVVRVMETENENTDAKDALLILPVVDQLMLEETAQSGSLLIAIDGLHVAVRAVESNEFSVLMEAALVKDDEAAYSTYPAEGDHDVRDRRKKDEGSGMCDEREAADDDDDGDDDDDDDDVAVVAEADHEAVRDTVTATETCTSMQVVELKLIELQHHDCSDSTAFRHNDNTVTERVEQSAMKIFSIADADATGFIIYPPLQAGKSGSEGDDCAAATTTTAGVAVAAGAGVAAGVDRQVHHISADREAIGFPADVRGHERAKNRGPRATTIDETGGNGFSGMPPSERFAVFGDLETDKFDALVIDGLLLEKSAVSRWAGWKEWTRLESTEKPADQTVDQTFHQNMDRNSHQSTDKSTDSTADQNTDMITEDDVSDQNTNMIIEDVSDPNVGDIAGQTADQSDQRDWHLPLSSQSRLFSGSTSPSSSAIKATRCSTQSTIRKRTSARSTCTASSSSGLQRRIPADSATGTHMQLEGVTADAATGTRMQLEGVTADAATGTCMQLEGVTAAAPAGVWVPSALSDGSLLPVAAVPNFGPARISEMAAIPPSGAIGFGSHTPAQTFPLAEAMPFSVSAAAAAVQPAATATAPTLPLLLHGDIGWRDRQFFTAIRDAYAPFSLNSIPCPEYMPSTSKALILNCTNGPTGTYAGGDGVSAGDGLRAEGGGGGAGAGALLPNELCQFIAYFFERRRDPHDPSRARTAIASPKRMELVQSRNPDRALYVPAKLLGVAELLARWREQEQRLALLDASVDEAQEYLDTLGRTVLSIGDDFLRCRQQHARQSSRLLSLLGRLETVRSLGCQHTDSEIRFIERVDKLWKQIQEPTMAIGLIQQQFKNRMYHDRIHRDSNDHDYDDDDDDDDSDNGNEVTAETLEHFVLALEQQRTGLEFLAETIEKDAQDMVTLRTRLKMQENANEG